MTERDVCSHVRVVVRVRPANPRELEGNFKNVVQVVDNHMLIFDPKEEEVTFFHGQKLRNRDVSKRANKDLKFIFDNVFGEDSTQQNIFENSTKGILDGVLNGYNCTGKVKAHVSCLCGIVAVARVSQCRIVYKQWKLRKFKVTSVDVDGQICLLVGLIMFKIMGSPLVCVHFS